MYYQVKNLKLKLFLSRKVKKKQLFRGNLKKKFVDHLRLSYYSLRTTVNVVKSFL